MKTRYLVGTTLLFVLAAFAAPVAVDGQITIGLKGGANFADLSEVQSGVDKSSETKFVGGVFAQFGFSGGWAIQPEVLYSQRASTLTDGGEAAEFGQKFIEIPVLLNYRIGTGIVEPQVFAGVSASFETSCDVSVEGIGSGTCDEVIEESATNSTLWAGIVGAALDFDIGMVGLGVEARYNYGFTKLLPDEPGFEDTRWQYFSVMARVGIGLGL